MNQRYTGIVTAGTNLTRYESETIDALIQRVVIEPSLAERRAKILADIDAENAALCARINAPLPNKSPAHVFADADGNGKRARLIPESERFAASFQAINGMPLVRS